MEGHGRGHNEPFEWQLPLKPNLAHLHWSLHLPASFLPSWALLPVLLASVVSLLIWLDVPFCLWGAGRLWLSYSGPVLYSIGEELTWCVLTLCPPQPAVNSLILLETMAVIGTASCEWKIHPVLPTQRSSSSHVRYYFTNYLGDSDASPSLKASFRIVWVSGIFKSWDTFHHSG